MAGVGAFALHNQIDWEWKQTALTLLAYPIPVLVACAAGSAAAVVARARAAAGPRGAGGGGVFALAVDPRDATGAEQSARSAAPTGSRPRAALDEARVEADLAAALDRTSVNAQLERASLLQQLGRPRDARRAVDHALSLAPKNDRTWLTLAGYQRWLLERPRLAQEPRPRARALGPRHVFAGTDAEVVAASDACTTG